MRRPRDLHLPPIAWVAIVAGVVALVRYLAALQLRTPIVYPDEYRATAFARSFAEGALPRIRGEFHSFNFTSYIPSVLQAPAWLISDVDVAYRVAQAIGLVAFAAAAFPAYVLARQLGITGRGSVLVAALALLVPAGAYTSTLLSEPYAYPAFLLALVLGLRTLTEPTLGLQLATLAVAGALCLVGGLQFAFFGLAYVAAWLLAGPRTPRAVLRRMLILASGVALCLAISALVADGRFLDILVSIARRFDYSPGPLAAWFGANVFVLAVAAGWVLIPGAALGLYGLARSTLPRQRMFALLSVLLLAAMLAEAAIMSRTYGLHERFAFYGAPLLAIGFVWWAEQGEASRRAYRAIAYAAAAVAILLPTTTLLEGALDHSPTMLGLFEVSFGDEIGPLVWAPILTALALVVGWRGLGHPRAVAFTVVAVTIVLSIGTSITFVNLTRDADAPHVDAPEGSTIVTWSGARGFSLQETLFWNPEITRVTIVGPGPGLDPYAVTMARLAPGPRLVDETGEDVAGPYVLGPDTTALGDDTPRPAEEPFVTLTEVPEGLVFGLYPSLGRIGVTGNIHASATQRSDLTITLSSPDEERSFGIRCTGGFGQTTELDSTSTVISLPVQAQSVRSCTFLVSGTHERVGSYRVGAEASVSLE